MKNMEVYRCKICGMQFEVTAPCGCDSPPLCCGEVMHKQHANTVDAAKEKHVPVIEKTTGGIVVKVGAQPHPMIAEHFIEWIEVVDGSRSCRVFLKAGEEPRAEFCGEFSPAVAVRISCNIHGLWQNA